MNELKLDVVRFVDDSFPGWVECEFVDAAGCRHVLKDKVPTFSAEGLDAGSRYPQPGSVQCMVLKRWKDDNDRELVAVSLPGVESEQGLSEFVVFLNQMSKIS